jgi:hypothetical protein
VEVVQAIKMPLLLIRHFFANPARPGQSDVSNAKFAGAVHQVLTGERELIQCSKCRGCALMRCATNELLAGNVFTCRVCSLLLIDGANNELPIWKP